jgi:hypothetical protein
VYSLVVVVICLTTVTSIAAITAIPGTTGTPSSTADASAASAQEGGGLSGDIDLSDADTKFVGNASNDDAGHDVAPAGDVNGDGEQDVLVAAPRNNSKGPNSGEVYLFYGPVSEGEIDVSEADVTLTGASGDHAGLSIAADDVDGDGLSDVVVGAPYNDTGGTNAGAVYVVRGSSSLTAEVHLPSEADATYNGENDFDLLGFSVATVGDEGSDSVLAGAPGDDTGGQNAGAAYLVRDENSGESAVGTAADVTYTGAGEADRAGWSVSAAGDVTGDGWGEVIVGAPRNDSTGFNAGAAYVLATDRGGQVSVTRGLTLEGEAAEDWAGFAVSDAGDVNDDGFGDVVVGAPYNDAAGNDSGAAYVVYGSDGLSGTQAMADADLVLTGESTYDRAGWSVSSAGSGDVNCDEFDDVLVGAPYNNSTAANAGAAYLVYGGQDGERSLSSASAKFWGEGQGDLAGWAVDEAEDASGDGLEDVFVGAVDNDTGGEDAGAAYLIQGQCPVEDEEETPTPKDRKTPTLTETPEETPTPKQTPTEEPLEPIHLKTDCESYKLHNPNPVTVKVHVDGPDDRTIKLHPGEKKRVTGVTPGEYTFTATDLDGERVPVNDQREVTTQIEKCPTPTPTETESPTPTKTEEPGPDLGEIGVDQICKDGDGVLELSNPNNVAVTVTLQHPDGTTEMVQIDAQSTVSVSGLADGSYQLKAETTDGEKVKVETASLEVDCDVELVGVDIETDCVDGQGEITVTNPNDEPVVVLVDRAAEYDNSTTVQPGESVTFGDLDDGEYNVETINETSREIVKLELVNIACD